MNIKLQILEIGWTDLAESLLYSNGNIWRGHNQNQIAEVSVLNWILILKVSAMEFHWSSTVWTPRSIERRDVDQKKIERETDKECFFYLFVGVFLKGHFFKHSAFDWKCVTICTKIWKRALENVWIELMIQKNWVM